MHRGSFQQPLPQTTLHSVASYDILATTFVSMNTSRLHATNRLNARLQKNLSTLQGSRVGNSANVLELSVLTHLHCPP